MNNKKILEYSGLFIGLVLAVFLGMILAQNVNKPAVNPINGAEDLGAFNRQVVSATSTQFAVNATPKSVKTLMKIADPALTDDKFNGINYVVIQPTNGTIRYLVGSTDIILNSSSTAGTIGSKIFATQTRTIKAAPEEIYLFRDSTESTPIRVEIAVFGSDTY